MGVIFLFLVHYTGIPNLKLWVHLYRLVEVVFGIFNFDAWSDGLPPLMTYIPRVNSSWKKKIFYVENPVSSIIELRTQFFELTGMAS